MSDTAALWICLSLLIFVAAGAVVLWFAKEKPSKLSLLAGQLQLSFNPDEDRSIPARFHLEEFNDDPASYAFNVLAGDYDGQEILAFDYHDEITDSSSSAAEFSMLILVLPARFPKLRIAPEDLFNKTEQMLGWNDINFESAAFSKAFTVKTADKKFAYDVCNSRMMEYLLANPDLNIEINEEALALRFSDTLSPALVQLNLPRLVDIRSRLPDYLFTKSDL